MKLVIINLITHYSLLYGVDPQVSLAVARVESNFNPNAIGMHGEVGIYQLMPQYANVPREALFHPVINVMEGIKRIKLEQEKCVHKGEIDYLVCYNYGRTAAKRVKHPKLFPYVMKVRESMIQGFK